MGKRALTGCEAVKVYNSDLQMMRSCAERAEGLGSGLASTSFDEEDDPHEDPAMMAEQARNLTWKADAPRYAAVAWLVSTLLCYTR